MTEESIDEILHDEILDLRCVGALLVQGGDAGLSKSWDACAFIAGWLARNEVHAGWIRQGRGGTVLQAGVLHRLELAVQVLKA